VVVTPPEVAHVSRIEVRLTRVWLSRPPPLQLTVSESPPESVVEVLAAEAAKAATPTMSARVASSARSFQWNRWLVMGRPFRRQRIARA
jgi:hypothetical protein